MALRTNRTAEGMAQVQADVNDKLAQAIEDLRIKYEKKAEAEAAAKAAAKEKALEEAKPAEADWSLGDADDDIEKLRRSRMAALKSRAAASTASRQAGGGVLREIAEDEFLKEVTGAKYVVAHFFHAEFVSCKVMDKHLRLLAARHPTVRFVTVNAEKAPFFVAKLRVRVLPTLVFFVDGVAVGRQTGFEGLVTAAATAEALGLGRGGLSSSTRSTAAEDFPTSSLARVLKASGVLGPQAKEAADSDDEDGAGGAGGGDGSRLDDEDDDLYNFQVSFAAPVSAATLAAAAAATTTASPTAGASVSSSTSGSARDAGSVAAASASSSSKPPAAPPAPVQSAVATDEEDDELLREAEALGLGGSSSSGGSGTAPR